MNESVAEPQTTTAPPTTRMGICAKCRRNRQVYKGGDVYWCKPCIRHEERRRKAGKTQEGE